MIPAVGHDSQVHDHTLFDETASQSSNPMTSNLPARQFLDVKLTEIPVIGYDSKLHDHTLFDDSVGLVEIAKDTLSNSENEDYEFRYF